MKRKVRYARIHDIKVVIPKYGQLQTEFPPKNKSLEGLQMFWDGTTLDIEIKDLPPYGIPAANVQWLEFEKEQAASPDTSKGKPSKSQG